MPEQELGASIKYNPHLLGAEELRTIFVARKKELQQILDNISKTEVKTIPQHILITGHRGMGKSTLLQRVALAVNEDVTLSESWLPLRFPEEQYTVSTLAELWSNVLGVLADTLDENGETDHGIDALLEEIEQLPKEQQEQQALVYIQQWCDKKQRRLLLLMDSSDLLLSNLSHSAKSKKVNAGASQLWRLRDTLQNNPNLFWLGGSYQPLEAESLYHDTFLDFFYNIELKPLTLKEMRKTMQEMARVFGAGHGLKGDKAVAQISQVFNQYPERLTILHRLTGGNLRTTTMLYELFIANEKNNIHGDLKRLLDVMTPLYKARIEALADQPRKILAHLFEYWGPISLAQLAEISGLEKSSLSPQLKRLEQEGMVEKTQLSGTKSKGYQVTERFFNIWYLMRNAPRRLRQRLNYLIEFMRLWFSSDELIQLANQNLQHHNHHSININDYEYSRALAATLPEQNATKHQLEWVVFRQIRQQFQDKLGDLFDLKGDDKPFSASDDYLQRLEVLPEKLRQCSFAVTDVELDVWVERILSSPSLCLEEKELLANSTSMYSRSQFEELNKVSIDETKWFKEGLGSESFQLIKEAIYQGNFFPDCPDSKLAYSQLISCFSNDLKAFRLALSLFKARHHDQWIEKSYKYILNLKPEEAEIWNDFGIFLSLYTKQYNEAEHAYHQSIKYKPALANPWFNLGVLLCDHFYKYEKSEEAYRQAIKLNPKMAASWYGLARLLSTYFNRYEEAEQAYRKAIKLNAEIPGVWNDLGSLLVDKLQRSNDAEQAFRQCIKIDENFVYGFQNLARVLIIQNKDMNEVLELYRTVIDKALKNDNNLLLQAHLYLGNQDLAMQALNHLAEHAKKEDSLSFFQIKEQCSECYTIGLGVQLADIMIKSSYSDFLHPFILALQVATGDEQALLAVPVEMADMAKEVLQEIQKSS